ncbi:uncharacterized protein DC041_0009772 [Schistosoma bovis]|uniref:Uncharacterized protein n=1 Tax=Schistosoma bovis TaxID=6184 RepID=A0A430QBC5_SCHBO|nr:uncharacterized protein DC041_0009772 [Schistosoma bovis]
MNLPFIQFGFFFFKCLNTLGMLCCNLSPILSKYKHYCCMLSGNIFINIFSVLLVIPEVGCNVK